MIKGQRSNRYIFLLLLFVVVLWGINVVMIKYLTRYFPPLALAPIRLCLASCLLVPAVVWKQGIQIPPRNTWLKILGVAVFSIFLHQITMTWGIANTSSTNAVLILGLNPLLTTVLASFLVRERFTAAKACGVLLGFCGVALIVYGEAKGTATLLGDAMMVIAMLTFVIGSLFVKTSTSQVSPLVVTAFSHVAASVGLIVMGFWTNPVWMYEGALEIQPIAVLLFSSLVNTALGALWWNTGIQHVGASTASLFQNGIPVVGVFASALFLNEPLYGRHLIALVLVLFGVSLGTGLIGSRRINEKRE